MGEGCWHRRSKVSKLVDSGGVALNVFCHLYESCIKPGANR